MNGIDPAIQATLRVALSALFAWAAVHKLRDVGAFRLALERYELILPPWSVPAGALLIALELGIAVGLWLPRVSSFAALVAAALLSLYGGAIAINLWRGRRDIDCGCAGPARRQPLSGWLVARNAGLALAAVAGALPCAGRALTWLDGVTVAAGIAALVLLYGAADGLLTLAPRLAPRRSEDVEIARA